MTSLVIQIPCYNEEQTIQQTIRDLPTKIKGIDAIIFLLIDDGSSDKTIQVALQSGVDYIVRHRRNRGLSQAFMTGITTALALGADIIVNTDADNQYPGKYIPDLVAPILSGSSDIVIGDRQTGTNKHFSFIKQQFEKLGSSVVRYLSETDTPDAPSGFRAYSRYAALRLHVYNSYSYTLETIIQAGKERMGISHLAIETNPTIRPSRLHKGMLNFIWHQAATIIRTYILYQPLKSFVLLGLPFFGSGIFLIARFLFFYINGESDVARHIQSVSIGGTLLIFGMLSFSLGLLGDAIRANRKTMEDILVQLRSQSTISTELFTEINGSPVIKNADGINHLPKKQAG